jgi:hypothetical protein
LAGPLNHSLPHEEVGSGLIPHPHKISRHLQADLQINHWRSIPDLVTLYVVFLETSCESFPQ